VQDTLRIKIQLVSPNNIECREAAEMAEVTHIVPAAIGAFATANHDAGDAICGAASADVEAMFAAAAAAIGPIGAPHYLPALASALVNHFTAASAVGQVHHAIGHAATATAAAHVASDNA
jgi:hypothetical protein